MKPHLPSVYRVLPDVALALSKGTGVVALESAVITHGLPRPVNRELADELEMIIRENGITPATMALIDGTISVGITRDELFSLANNEQTVKVSCRMMGIAVAHKLSGGTTVAATLVAAHTAGIQVFATGGIGGVHRGQAFDISADLDELARRPVIVVCAGAKAILDLPATLEALETRGVPVLGYQTEDFPAFYSRSSGLKVDIKIDSPEQAADIARAHWEAGNHSALLVCNPLPEDQALDAEKINQVIEEAINEAETQGISGSALTPFLLDKVGKISKGESLQTNLALLRNNARLAARIAASMAKPHIHTY